MLWRKEEEVFVFVNFVSKGDVTKLYYPAIYPYKNILNFTAHDQRIWTMENHEIVTENFFSTIPSSHPLLSKNN